MSTFSKEPFQGFTVEQEVKVTPRNASEAKHFTSTLYTVAGFYPNIHSDLLNAGLSVAHRDILDDTVVLRPHDHNCYVHANPNQLT
jgi:hypothetical protein